MPILRPYDTVGSTRYVDFDTTKPVYRTDPESATSPMSSPTPAPGSRRWRRRWRDEVVAYVKDQGLGFTIPYTIGGDEKQYVPDFIARVDDGHGPDDS
ncbi:MAG: hypothetical protein R2849_00885 [Thermomicrobiales bacterium]